MIERLEERILNDGCFCTCQSFPVFSLRSFDNLCILNASNMQFSTILVQMNNGV